MTTCVHYVNYNITVKYMRINTPNNLFMIVISFNLLNIAIDKRAIEKSVKCYERQLNKKPM